MGGKYQLLRLQLDELGYKQLLTQDAVPLVEKLVADLMQTTESLEKYKKIAKNATEERDNLELGAEPYKCDNAKLVRECNELHQAFLQYREKNEAAQKDLKKEIKDLQNQLSDCEKQKVKLREKVRDLEYASVISKNKRTGAGGKSASTSTLRDNKQLESSSKKNLEGTMSAANKKIAQLIVEIKTVKEEKLDLLDRCECYKAQVMSRDREIQRLSSLLEGGRPIQAVNSDCCYRDAEGRINIMQDEINILKREKCDLEICWKEAVAKQHEAMKRALHLANRNRELEKELKDIDQMALAVEADANSSAKINAEKVSKLQDKIKDALMQIQSLEMEVNQLRREKQEILSDWEGTKVEKKHLQALLETALEEKRLMTDRLNQLTIIEDDLNIEIDRLMQLSAEQKQKITELECRLMSNELQTEENLPAKKQQSVTINRSKSKTKSRSKSPLSSPSKSSKAKGSPSSKTKVVQKKKKGEKRDMSKEENLNMGQASSAAANYETAADETVNDKKVGTAERMCRCCNSASCVERVRMMLEKDLEQRQLQMCLISLDNIRSEKDYYMKEYHRLLEQLNNRSSRPDALLASDEMKRIDHRSSHSLQRELNQKLNEKDQIIVNLQKENKTLAEEKFNLMSRLETIGDRNYADMEAASLKRELNQKLNEKDQIIKKLEKEKDVLAEEKFNLMSRLETMRDRNDADMEVSSVRRELSQILNDKDQIIKNIQKENKTLAEEKFNLMSRLETMRDRNDAEMEISNLRRELNQKLDEKDQIIKNLQKEKKTLADEKFDLTSRLKTMKKRNSADLEIASVKRELSQILNDKDQIIKNLQKENKTLAEEKFNLMSTLETMIDRNEADMEVARLKRELNQKLEEKDKIIKNLQKEKKTLADEKFDLTSSLETMKNRNSADMETASLKRELNQKLNEKDQIIKILQKENKTLADENFNLMSNLERMVDRSNADMEIESLKATIKRLEREKELLKGKIDELQEDRDKLRNQMKEMFDIKSVASSHLETAKEAEQRLRAVEKENEELLQDQRVRRATITSQIDEIGALKSQLHSAQAELAHQKNLYNQLKNLQEQSDRSVSEAQNRIRQLENELADARGRLGSVNSAREDQGQQVINLKQDINALKRNLTQLENEKDDLLNSLDSKTEKIAKLEKEIRQKNGYITELEGNVRDLKQQISLAADGTSIKEQRLKSVSAENLNLRAELEAALKAKENALIENRRIQEELATCIAEGRKVHKDLEIAKRQIEDLKMQLQHYVAEVKRTEDLISQKESERSELLDQFRNLTDEAAHLENSNHSLASEATQSKVQLSVALEHANDLEKRLGDQEAVVMAYEKQIAELTSQVACLEIEVKKERVKNDKLEMELASLKSLCAKLDQQKDDMNRKLSEKSEMSSEINRLRRDGESLRDVLAKDRNNVDHLEKLLSDSRQEAVNLKLLNQELQGEIQRLKSKTEELQTKLAETAEQLDLFQEKTFEYSQQNKQLRREIANERFFNAKEDESKRYPSL